MPSASSDLKHIRSLDALRGYAALGVVLVHSAFMSGQTGAFLMAGIYGQRGVHLFYVVSAFTLFYSLSKRSPDEQHPTINFFVRRFFRIAPLFYAAIFANLWYQHVFKAPPLMAGVLSKSEILLGFFFLNGYSPRTINSVAVGGWSIAVETSFYLLVPFLFARIKTLRAAAFLLIGSYIGCAYFAMIGNHFLPGPAWTDFFYLLSFPVEFPIFVFGIFAFHLWKVVPKTKTWSIVLLLLALLQFIFALPHLMVSFYSYSFSFVPLILALLITEWKLLVNPVSVFLGRISYSIYLSHFYVLILVAWIFARYIPTVIGTRPGLIYFFVMTTLLTSLLSFCTFWLIEKTGMKLGKKLISIWEKAPTCAVPADHFVGLANVSPQ